MIPQKGLHILVFNSFGLMLLKVAIPRREVKKSVALESDND